MPGLVETLFLFLNDSYFPLSDKATTEVRPPPRGLQQGLGSSLRPLLGSCGALGTTGQAQLECEEEHPSWRSKEQCPLAAWLHVAHQPGALEGSPGAPELPPPQCCLKSDCLCCSFENGIFILISLYSAFHITEEKCCEELQEHVVLVTHAQRKLKWRISPPLAVELCHKFPIF